MLDDAVQAVADFTGDGRADLLLGVSFGRLVWDVSRGGAGFAGVPDCGSFQVAVVGKHMLQQQGTGTLLFYEPAAAGGTNPFQEFITMSPVPHRRPERRRCGVPEQGERRAA